MSLTALCAVVRLPEVPGSGALELYGTLHTVSPEAGSQVKNILIIPVGAVIVVFFRLTLGVRMLGPFRPILIGMAFEMTGIALGVSFIVVCMIVVLLLRPRLKGAWLPYYGRLTLLLCVVVLLIVVSVMISGALRWHFLEKISFFPIVVLMLTSDSFARSLADDGPRTAIWRGFTTVFIAVAIYLVANAGIQELLAARPELILLCLASIVFLANYGRLKFADRFTTQADNPAPTQRQGVESAPSPKVD